MAAAIYLTKARLGWRENDPAPAAASNITIQLPDSKTPEQYLRQVKTIEGER